MNFKFTFILILFFVGPAIVTSQVCADGSAVESIAFNLNGINTQDVFGAAGNDAGTLSFASGVEIDVIGFSVEGAIVNPAGASRCSEAAIAFGGVVGISPGGGDNVAGPCPGSPYTAAYMDLGAFQFTTDATGTFAWEGYESFDDAAGVVDQTFGGGTITLYGCPDAIAAPVELLSFGVEPMEKLNKVSWSTATEENTEYHAIERSADGSSNWNELGQVKANGFSQTKLDYEWMDERPLTNSFYRLRSVDFDGKDQLSEIVSVERDDQQFGIIGIRPVPTTDVATMDFETTKNEKVTLQIMDISGKIMFTESFEANNGYNSYQLDLNQFGNGVYFVCLENSVQKITQRVMKQ